MFDKRLLALPRGGRHPERELRRPRLQHEDPEDRPLRRGAGEGSVRARATIRPARPRSCTATWRRRCSMARKRASMREGPLAELFRATEAAQRQAEREPAGEAPPQPPAERRPSAARGDGRARPDVGGRGRRRRRTPPRRRRPPRREPSPNRAASPSAVPAPRYEPPVTRLEPLPEPAPRLHRVPRGRLGCVPRGDPRRRRRRRRPERGQPDDRRRASTRSSSSPSTPTCSSCRSRTPRRRSTSAAS